MTSFREARASRVITRTIEWRGVTIETQFDPDWLGLGEQKDTLGLGYAHLELRVVSPEGRAIPVTETGYRSHFLSQGMVEEAGGVEAYVIAWLDEAARDRRWLLAEEQRRQLDLFA